MMPFLILDQAKIKVTSLFCKMKQPVNKKQRQWLKAFTAAGYKERFRRDQTCGYWEFIFEFVEYLPTYLVPGTHPGVGYITYELYLELTPSAKTRNEKKRIKSVVYPHCLLEEKTSLKQAQGQTTLPLGQLLSEPRLKAVPVRKPARRRQIFTQLSLPVAGLAQQLWDNKQSAEPISAEYLLSEKAEHYSLDLKTVITLHQGIVDLLLAAKATSAEWEAAVCLNEVAGPAAAISYIQGLSVFRTLFSTQPQLDYQVAKTTATATQSVVVS